MLRWLMFLAVFLYATVPLATADQYWVAWEGDDFPENEGWERIASGGGAIRALVDGVMALDGLGSTSIADGYRVEGFRDPVIGEEFVVQWGLRVNEVGNANYPYDPGWGFDRTTAGVSRFTSGRVSFAVSWKTCASFLRRDGS